MIVWCGEHLPGVYSLVFIDVVGESILGWVGIKV
jgi:hypothetical protein